MAQTIYTNVASLNSQRSLNNSQGMLNTALQRLSSGLRINSAKDDAAGMAISSRMTAQINGLNQAGRNANDGISLAQTAEGALQSVTDSLQRMRTLAVQASNATNSTTDRAALQKEVDQLVQQINTVASQTSFNGVKLLDGSFNTQAFQVGANAGEMISIDSIKSAKADALGVGTTSSYQTQLSASNVVAGNISSGGITVNGYGIGPTVGDGVSFELSATALGTSAPAASANKLTYAAPSPASYLAADPTATVSGLTINGTTIADFDVHTTGTASTATEVTDRIVAAITAAGIQGLTATNVSDQVQLSMADGSDITITGATAVTGLNAAPVAVDTSYTTGAFTINGATIGAITVASGSTAAEAAQQIATGINTALATGNITDITASVENGMVKLTSTGANIEIAGTPTGTGLATGTSESAFVRSEGSAISKASAFNAVSGQTGVSAKAAATTLTGSVATAGAVAGDNTNFLSINGVKLGAIAAGADAAAQANNVAAAINAVSNQTGVTATFDNTGKISLSAADGRNITVKAGGTGAANSGLTTGTTFGGLSLNSTSSAGITLGGADLAKSGLSTKEGYNAAEATFGTGVSTIDVSTAAGAQNALATIDSALAQVNSSRADLGALQNRFSSVVANLATTSENVTAARSRIQDADFAEETAALSKAQILQQAGVAMLSQANALPQNVLSLLR
ncbi:flagellin [Azonexus sp.]|uniref:flagellin N-terminal helical domain-containing protein n=1 Tax=Azonexus sp. TaxID=1872668 RepID=UPI0035AE4AAF